MGKTVSKRGRKNAGEQQGVEMAGMIGGQDERRGGREMLAPFDGQVLAKSEVG